MKRTFRFLAMGLLAVGLLASCNKKENNNGTADGKGFKAITEQNGGGNSRTHGVLQGAGTADECLEVQWTDNDQIKVNNGSETSTFALTSGENTTTGEFHVTNGSSFDFTSGDFYAIYPATNAAGVENTIDGATATFNLPATQVFSTEHSSSFAEKALPMVAHSTNQTLQFKNVLGGLCFSLVGLNNKVTRVVLTSNDNEALWGTCTTTIDADGYPTNTIVSNDETNKNVITIDCGTGITLDAINAIEFTVMVPPTTLANGFTIAIYDGNNKIDEMSTTANPSIARSAISIVNRKFAVRGITISENYDYAWFAPGNLQYVGSAATPYWRFAANQWECLGTTTGQNSDNINVDRDLFGWGTSGYDNTANDPYAINFHPYSISSEEVNTTYNYYGYGPSINMSNPDIARSNYDWGVYNAIYNPSTGNTDAAGTWRALTFDEWNYLVYSRSASTLNGTDNARFVKATVNDMAGLILFPDRYLHPTGVTLPLNINMTNAPFADNDYRDDSWDAMEEVGCVFLPTSGVRRADFVDLVGSGGYYWFSTRIDNQWASRLYFSNNSMYLTPDRPIRYHGFAVRLACPGN